MYIFGTVILFLSCLEFITGEPAGKPTCNEISTLSTNSAGSKTGRLPGSSTTCLWEFEATCKDCYMEIVFWKVKLGSTEPRRWSRVGSTIPVMQEAAFIIQEDGNSNMTIFQGNLRGQFFVTDSKKVKITYNGGTLKEQTSVFWNISYTVREIKRDSCFWGVLMRYTCPDRKCTDKPYECGKMAQYLDIPPPGHSKEDKADIFMGILGAVGIVIVIFIIALLCWRRETRKKMYLFFTCKECKCLKKTSEDHPPQLVKANSIIIDSEEPPEYTSKDALDTEERPKTEHKQGYVPLKVKDEDE